MKTALEEAGEDVRHYYDLWKAAEKREKRLAELTVAYLIAHRNYDVFQTNGIRDAKWGEQLHAADDTLTRYLQRHYPDVAERMR
jgi:3-keto-L-gulonate-6-phosphate decarboxylase